MRCPMLLLLSLLAPPIRLTAQQLPLGIVPDAVDPPVSALRQATSALVLSPPPDPVRMGLGGVLAGTGGALAGGAIGVRLTNRSTCDDCALVGLAYGLVAGWSTGVPLGVHLANGRKGSYSQSLLASLAIGAAGFGATLASGKGAIMIAVPIVQLVSSISIERATSR